MRSDFCIGAKCTLVSVGDIGSQGHTPKKFGRLRQTNDVLATFKKQRNGGGKGANNENKKRTERRYNTVKCNGASQSSLRKNRAINHRGDLKMNKDKRVTVRFTKKRI